MMRTICVVVTARASYARIRTALEAIGAHPDLELQLVVAASALLDRYGNAAEVIERDGFHIDRRVYMIVEGENLLASAKSTGIGTMEIATVLDGLKPDAVVTIADRYETIATAIAASYMNIPLVHVQGGEVTGSIDEKVRHAVTKLADLHFVASQRAADRVIRMGEGAESVFVTGCPSIDLAKRAIATPDGHAGSTTIGGVGAEIDLNGDFLIVLHHPVTTEYAASRQNVEETLYAVADLGTPALWFWPNVDAGSDGTAEGIRAFRERHALPQIRFVKNVPPDAFIRLARRARCVVGNSSVAIRECSWLGVPAVNIGTRQANRDRGSNVVDVAYDRQAIAAAIRTQVARARFPCDPLYGDGCAGERMANLLATVPLTIEKRLSF